MFDNHSSTFLEKEKLLFITTTNQELVISECVILNQGKVLILHPTQYDANENEHLSLLTFDAKGRCNLHFFIHLV